jgi:reactive intermediate/imine deaminase
MTVEAIRTDPDPYSKVLISQAIRFGGLLFVSGQTAYGPDGRTIDGGFREQGEQSFRNLRRVLEAGGSSLDRVLKVTIFVTDMSRFSEVVDLRRTYFSEPYPADSIVEVAALHSPGVMIEIEAIAAVAEDTAP